MSKRLFVGNLAYGTTEPGLRALFEGRGWTPDDVVIVTDRETGRSRGFGFVELGDDNVAQAAIEALDGFEFEGRSLSVREAYARAPRQREPSVEVVPEEAPRSVDGGGERRRRGGGSGAGGGGRRDRGRNRYDDDDW